MIDRLRRWVHEKTSPARRYPFPIGAIPEIAYGRLDELRIVAASRYESGDDPIGPEYVCAIAELMRRRSDSAASDAEPNRPKDWSEVRQRLRDAGADRWDDQRSWREEAAAELQEYQLPGYLAAIDLLRSENFHHAADRLRAYLGELGWTVTTSEYGSTAHRDFNDGGRISNSGAGTSKSDSLDVEDMADLDRRLQHEQDGRDGYVERMLD